MSAEYILDKVAETELMDESLRSIIPGAIVSSSQSSNHFISYGEGIVDENFYLGSLVTKHLNNITINNLSSYILSIPKNGAYSVKNTIKEERNILGKSGVLTLSTNKVIYDSATEYVDDYAIILNKKNLNSKFEKKYSASGIQSDMLALSMKNKQVQSCFQFIESTLNMLRAFPETRNSGLVKKNLQEIATFIVIEIIAEYSNAKLLANTKPEKHLVAKAEEIIEAECENLFTFRK